MFISTCIAAACVEGDSAQLQRFNMNLVINAASHRRQNRQHSAGPPRGSKSSTRLTSQPRLRPDRWVPEGMCASRCKTPDRHRRRDARPYVRSVLHHEVKDGGLGLAAAMGSSGVIGEPESLLLARPGTTFRVLFPATKWESVRPKPRLSQRDDRERDSDGGGRRTSGAANREGECGAFG